MATEIGGFTTPGTGLPVVSEQIAPLRMRRSLTWLDHRAGSPSSPHGSVERTLRRLAEGRHSSEASSAVPAACIGLLAGLRNRHARPCQPRLRLRLSAASGRSEGGGNSIFTAAWYPLCFTRTTDGAKPHSIDLCGAPVVYWRGAESKWHAMLDECPHRRARLSEGRVKENGHIECPYHGWSFEGCSGACSKIPQAEAEEMPRLLPGAQAMPLPTAERNGILFAWAAPLYGAQDEPDWQALDELAHVDIFETPGVKYVDYSRDVPMDLTTLMENVLDPAHLPFTHHETISNRNKATPVPIKVKGKLHRHGFFAERYTSAPGQVTFVAPSHVIALTDRPDSYRDWNIVYGTPARPGRCRIFVRVVFEVSKIPPPLNFIFEYAFSPMVPPCFTHMSNHRVLEDDNIFLHYQGETLSPGGVQDESWRSKIHVPTSSDAAVVAFRRWLEEHAGGGVQWARACQPERPPSREMLIERLHSHTEHCSSCSEALRIARDAQRVTEVGILLGILGAELLDETRWICAGGALLAFALRASALDVEAKLTKGEYPPPRNLPSLDFINLLSSK